MRPTRGRSPRPARTSGRRERRPSHRNRCRGTGGWEVKVQTCRSPDSRVENGTSDVDGDVADGSTDAQLDLLVRLVVCLTGAHVSGTARLLDGGAGEADSHPASVLGIEARSFCLFEKCFAGVLGRHPTFGE